MDDNRLFALFEQYLQGALSEVEVDELMRVLKGLSDEELSAILSKSWNEQTENQHFFSPAVREKMLARIQPAEVEEANMYSIGGRKRRWRWMAAAAVLVFLVFGLWFMVGRNRSEKPSMTVGPRMQQDIAPGGDKAILTLADGSQVVLDTVSNGSFAQEGGVKIIKIGGQLRYNSESKATEVVYNTITTPKGGQYQLELADGSKVWLNAASSLRFPTDFTGKERRVELTGEGYFEVAHNASKPFIVGIPLSGGNKGGMDVQVLGTHFNINSYSDEPSIKTTLLEGRVQVKKGEKHVYLNPGQQAVLQPGQEEITINYDVDGEEVVAWKNGLFNFNNTPLQTVMKQLERWYNVDVSYQGKIPQVQLNGSIGRSTNLSEVLKILEYSEIHFRIEGKTIVVLPE